MGKIRENNPLFTTKLHNVENFLRTSADEGYIVLSKCTDFIGNKSFSKVVGESGKNC